VEPRAAIDIDAYRARIGDTTPLAAISRRWKASIWHIDTEDRGCL